ncbi:Fic/DOC family protein [Aggregatibacter actinomycetemcomitans]|uniref:Fic/DOC family protein n=1 Tax=Aggregatibacter actinomycetemcomitans TaxID=714 RepID=UPI00197BF58F|nr:Fic family protein [Aggregatibacter actinomycetemcomitans]MBN6078464.1 Fic family protein [Aggregatibacter actinomycetemcomitans]MBN6078847.1 Fic family protein [Aggregatibacter actinomycetemcomitans]MBN6078877.1 Fic family protein [Aggregatibacter actinomycetemcomitans]MBN6078882.1 Fic family protein [Aggregatibacter actinomycetemcomitans]
MGLLERLNPFKKKGREEISKEDDLVSFVNVKEEDKWAAYFYPSTYNPQTGLGVMKNLKGLKDDDFLMLYENFSVASNLPKLNDLNKEISIQHLKDIHKTLFQEVYSWAGEFRQVNMSKGNSAFSDYRDIEKKLESVMQDFNNLSSVKNDKAAFSDRLCQIYLKLNDIHAFREGNGRTQNTFIKHVCEQYDYSLDLQKIMNDMRKNSFDYYSLFKDYHSTQDYSAIKKFLFDPNLVKNTQKQNLSKAFSETYKRLQDNVEQQSKQSNTNKNTLKFG